MSQTIFTTLPGCFPNIGNDKIKTAEFVVATKSVVIVLEKFGKVFQHIVHNINENIKKIDSKHEENKKRFEYIEDMVSIGEGEEGHGEQIIIRDALRWLKRYLLFVSELFILILGNSDENGNSQNLVPLIKAAYFSNLEQYHGWLGMQLLNILARSAPKRSHLFYIFALDRHDADEHVLRDMQSFRQRMSMCIDKLPS